MAYSEFRQWMGVINQYFTAFQGSQLALILYVVLFRPAHAEPEGAAAAPVTLQTDGAAHAFHQPFGNNESETGAPEAPGGGSVTLTECCEQTQLFLFGKTDSCVI